MTLPVPVDEGRLILERTLPPLKSAGELLALPAPETLASGEITPDDALKF